MAKASYKHQYLYKHGRKWLIIIDLKDGVSLTNDIRNVVHEIMLTDRIDIFMYTIVYRDQYQIWDCWLYTEDDYQRIGRKDLNEALERYNKLYPLIPITLDQ